MNRITAMIVDDESLARANVREALKPLKNWQLVSEIGSSANAVSAITELQPQVLFIDIHMPGQSGIDVVRHLLTPASGPDLGPNNGRNPAPLIVFITAFDQYAIEAFELFAFDYLLKPFDDVRFAASVARIEYYLGHANERRIVQRHQADWKAQQNPLERLVIRSVGSIRIVQASDIFWLRASGNYVEVGHTDGVHLQRVRLSYLEQHLDHERFCRTHRSAIVALKEVREYRPGNDDNGVVITRDGIEVPVSSRYRAQLFEKLGIDAQP